jgi:hypothetical protein
VALDRASAGTDDGVETVDRQQAAEAPPPPPDRPGAEGTPSRADSRAAAAKDNSPQPPDDDKPNTSSPETADKEQATTAEDKPNTSATPEQGELDVQENGASDAPNETDNEPPDIPTSDSPAGRDVQDEQGTADIPDADRQQTQDGRTPAQDEAATAGAEDSSPDQQPSPEDTPRADEPTIDENPEPTNAQAPAETTSDHRKADQVTDTDPTVADRHDGGPPANGQRERAIVGGDAAEGGLLDSVKRSLGMPEQEDRPQELSDSVDRPDFQDPNVAEEKRPDRYGTPLERPDGTRIPLFEGEPTREQTKQGRLDDCGVIATLGAVAGHHPEAIRDCVRETDDGNYEVRLHEAKYSQSRMRYEPTGERITLTVTPDLPVYDASPNRPAFADSTSTGTAWAPVVEKAIAGVDQTWDRERREKWAERWSIQSGAGDPPEGYVRLNQGSFPIDRAELLTQLTGRPAKTWEIPTEWDNQGRSPDKQLLGEFRSRLSDDKPILWAPGTCGTAKNACHTNSITHTPMK